MKPKWDRMDAAIGVVILGFLSVPLVPVVLLGGCDDYYPGGLQTAVPGSGWIGKVGDLPPEMLKGWVSGGAEGDDVSLCDDPVVGPPQGGEDTPWVSGGAEGHRDDGP